MRKNEGGVFEWRGRRLLAGVEFLFWGKKDVFWGGGRIGVGEYS